MKLWIDATAADPRLRVFGMTLVERHIRGARHKAGATIPAIVDGNQAALAALPEDLQRTDTVTTQTGGSLSQRLREALAMAGGPLLVAAGNVAVDQRLYGELRQRTGSWIATEENRSVGLLRLEPGAPLETLGDIADWPALIEALLQQPGISQLRQEDFTAHIAALRRDLPFWLRRIDNEAQRAELERFMFKASY